MIELDNQVIDLLADYYEGSISAGNMVILRSQYKYKTVVYEIMPIKALHNFAKNFIIW